MFCSKCGKQLRDDARFCDGCGSPTKVQQAAGQNTGNYQPYTEPWAAPQPVQTKPKKKTGLIVALVLVAVLAVAALVFFYAIMGPTTIAEYFEQKDWEFASIYLTENGKTSMDMYTYEPELVQEIWEEVSEMTIRPSLIDGVENRKMDPYIDLLLYGSDVSIRTELMVFEDGTLGVSQGDTVMYYFGAEELYAALNRYIPENKEILLRNWLGNESWSAISLNLYDSAGETLDSAYITDAVSVSAVTDAIESIRVGLSGDKGGSNSGREIWLFLHGEDGNMASIFVYYDGKGGMKNGDWTYSFSSLELYQTLKGLL